MSAKSMLQVTLQLEVKTRKAQACSFQEGEVGEKEVRVNMTLHNLTFIITYRDTITLEKVKLKISFQQLEILLD